jgi:hypothetical protein
MSTTATTITYEQVHKPNKKRYLVMDGDVVEYIIKAKTDKKGTRIYKLYHSDSDIWREKTKGTLAFSMYDNGWNIRFKSPEEGFDIKKIDYSNAMYIRLLTTLHASLEQNDPLPRVVEDTGDVIVCE